MYMLFCATTVVNKDEYKILLKTDVRRKFVPGDRIGMSGHNNNTVTIVTLLSYTAQSHMQEFTRVLLSAYSSSLSCHKARKVACNNVKLHFKRKVVK